jgi:hypothetical protein
MCASMPARHGGTPKTAASAGVSPNVSSRAADDEHLRRVAEHRAHVCPPPEEVHVPRGRPGGRLRAQARPPRAVAADEEPAVAPVGRERRERAERHVDSLPAE